MLEKGERRKRGRAGEGSEGGTEGWREVRLGCGREGRKTWSRDLPGLAWPSGQPHPIPSPIPMQAFLNPEPPAPAQAWVGHWLLEHTDLWGVRRPLQGPELRPLNPGTTPPLRPPGTPYRTSFPCLLFRSKDNGFKFSASDVMFRANKEKCTNPQLHPHSPGPGWARGPSGRGGSPEMLLQAQP